MFSKWVLVISVLICAVNGEQNACFVDGIDNLHLIHISDKVILDTHQGVIETFPIINLDSAFIKNSSYLTAYIENNSLVISTTPEFSQIEDREVNLPLTVTLVTVCDGEQSELQYVLQIEDTNNHTPTFEQAVYNYIFDSVIPDSDFNLNEFEEVAVRDADSTSQNVTFTIEENDYLELRDQGKQDPGNLRRYVANLALRQNILAPFQQTFVITATDAGKRSSTANITLTVFRSDGFTFTRSLYEAHLSKDRQIIMDNDEIALQDVSNYKDIHFDVSAEYSNFFKLTITDSIALELSEDADPSGLISEEKPSVAVTIYAKGQDPEMNAETVILLNMEVLLDNIESTTEISITDEISSEVTDYSTDPETVPTEDDSKENTDFTENIDDTTDFFPEVTSQPSHPKQELRGFTYWVDVNKTYIILFTVLTSCAVLVFLCITCKRSHERLS